MKRIRLLAIMLWVAITASAQEATPDMADALRANGKIYVVVTVIGIIFTGIISYLVYIDRKISKLEK